MPEYREIVVGQSARALTNWAAAAVRKPRQIRTDDLPDPPRPALEAAEKMLRERGGGGVLAELDGSEPVLDPSGPLYCPDGMFDGLEGHEGAKTMLRAALAAPRPVHVLLVGEPATGKSDLLRSCMAIPRARYAVGGMVTPSGMVEYLLEQPGTSIVLIDELDKVREPGDYAALYELMESGQVPRMVHGKTEVLRWRGRVFAAANETDRVPQALLSRFRVVQLQSYNRQQLLHVNRVVAEREGVSAKRAVQIAELTAGRSNDPRDARDLARMAGEDGELAGLLEQVGAPKRPRSR